MKPINLISLVQAHQSLEDTQFSSFCEYFQIQFKDHEVDDIKSLIASITNVTKQSNIYDDFYVGYKIPQIGKEFDLLRFGDSIINIELKSEFDESKIVNQLIRNKYYLSFLEGDLYSFTYDSSTKRMFTLNEVNELSEIEFKETVSLLRSQKIKEIQNLDLLFNPSNYLVSPVNAPERFLDGEYFLTDHQEMIKKEIQKHKGPQFFTVRGKAGTGKTLLIYDIAKQFLSVEEVPILMHIGKLNSGHSHLNHIDGWQIISIKNYGLLKSQDFDILIIDECQRVNPYQLEEMIKLVKSKKSKCVFSYDMEQCLRGEEERNNIENIINTIADPKIYTLKTKIRSNKEIAWFIVGLFDISARIEKLTRDNIKLTYFSQYEDAVKLMADLSEKGWKVINYTPDRLRQFPYEKSSVPFEEDNAHSVIGQEFDKVVAVVDQHFIYHENKLIVQYHAYYDPAKMLYQIMTRVRRKLHVIVINNAEILNRCLDMLIPVEASKTK